MGLRSVASGSAAVFQDISQVKNLRKAIFEMRDKLRNTPQFSDVFYRLIPDIQHPPRLIQNNLQGGFFTEGWDVSYNNYEPYTTQKLQDGNIGYIEGCAFYLLIQECYPSVYDFPNRTIKQLQNGESSDLVMKKQFVGKPLKPATVPPRGTPTFSSAPSTTSQPTVTPAASQGQTAAFCMHCGQPIPTGARFCSKCGSQL